MAIDGGGDARRQIVGGCRGRQRQAAGDERDGDRAERMGAHRGISYGTPVAAQIACGRACADDGDLADPIDPIDPIDLIDLIDPIDPDYPLPELPDITIYIEALSARIVGHTLERVRLATRSCYVR